MVVMDVVCVMDKALVWFYLYEYLDIHWLHWRLVQLIYMIRPGHLQKNIKDKSNTMQI